MKKLIVALAATIALAFPAGALAAPVTPQIVNVCLPVHYNTVVVVSRNPLILQTVPVTRIVQFRTTLQSFNQAYAPMGAYLC